MKSTLKSRTILFRLQIATVLVAVGFASAVRAGLNPPYSVDGNTLHLWHLQEASGVSCYDSVSNQNAQTYSFTLTNTPGPNAIPQFTGLPGYVTTNFTLLGQPGADPAYGYSNSILTAQYSCLYDSWFTYGYDAGVTTNWNPFPINANDTNICNFVNTNTGAFTFECLIQPQVNLATYAAESSQYLITGDSAGGAGTETPTRAWLFRIDHESSGIPELDFEVPSYPALGSNNNTNRYLFANLPVTGPDAIASGPPWPWYHVAIAWTGGAPTNGDRPHLLTMYWTKVDPTRTNGVADVLTNFPNALTFTNSTATGMLNWAPNTLTTGLYPSNSLAGTPMLAIGGTGRANVTNGVAGAAGFRGAIEEVRISMCYRHTNEFMFNTQPAYLPPTIGLSQTNNLLGYGGVLTLPASETGTQPISYQWYQIANGVTNALASQTNLTLTISNIAYSANGSYQLFATNAYGTTNSVLAQVTVGANCEALFNTGCGTNNNPLDVTAPGSVDLHWTIPVDPDTTAISNQAIVWSDASPVNTGGGLAPANGAAVWIGPHKNSGQTGGYYTYQTTFQCDEGATSNTVVNGNALFSNGIGGTTLQTFLNGVETDYVLPANPSTTPVAFTFTSANGLQPGSNTMAFTAQYISGDGYIGAVALMGGITFDTGSALTTAPVINNQPVGVTTVYGTTNSFSAVAIGAPPMYYYWLSNGVSITRPMWVDTALPYLTFAGTNFISASQLVGTNYFANIQIVFSNYVGAVTSAVATLDIQLPPLTVASAGVPIWSPTNDETTVVVYFSGPVNPATATNVANYTLNGATVVSATLGSAPGEVILTTSTALNPADIYTLTVQNVTSTLGIGLTPSAYSIAVGTYPTTVALWVKAGQGVTADSSGNVSQWNDLSGNANNLLTGGNDPQLVTNAIDGQPMIEFTGTNGTYLIANSVPSLQITNDMSVFVVINFATLASGTNGDIVSKVNNNNQPAPYDYYAQSGTVQFLRGNGTKSVAVGATNGPSTGVPHILDVVMAGTSVTHRLDGNPNGTGTLSTPIVDQGQPLSIGAREDFHNFLTGGMAELIVVSSALSASDVASIENYLATEYNMPTGTNSFPVITQQPVASTNVNQGGTLIVPATASGNPAPTYQWYDTNGVEIVGQTSSTLTVSDVQANDGYYLVAANQYGSVTSSIVTIGVITGLNVSLGPPTVTLYTGESVTLTATATGTLPFYYQWSENGSVIANATNASYTAIASLGANAYTCTVTNSYNGITSTNAGPVSLVGIAAPTNAFSQMILSSGPIAYWRLNEPSGSTIAYDYVGGYNGSYGANTTNGLPGVPFIGNSGELGVSMDNGVGSLPITNGYVSVPGINLNTNSVTFVCWVLPFTNQLNPSGLVFSRTGSNPVFGSQVGGNNNLAYTWNNNSATYDYGSGLVVRTNIWSLTALAVTPSNAVLYVFNSVASGSATNNVVNSVQSFSNGLSLGADNLSTNRIFNGEMDEVALFNYTLSASQLKQLYNAAAGAPTTVSTNPTNILFSVTSGQLSLSWPMDHLGWQLQAQTNNVKVGISTNWVNVSGSTLTNQIFIPINITNGSVFYRLMYVP